MINYPRYRLNPWRRALSLLLLWMSTTVVVSFWIIIPLNYRLHCPLLVTFILGCWAEAKRWVCVHSQQKLGAKSSETSLLCRSSSSHVFIRLQFVQMMLLLLTFSCAHKSTWAVSYLQKVFVKKHEVKRNWRMWSLWSQAVCFPLLPVFKLSWTPAPAGFALSSVSPLVTNALHWYELWKVKQTYLLYLFDL